MKILQVVKTNRGATWAFNQARQLKHMGVEVVTVLPDTHGGYADKYRAAGMRVIPGEWSLPVKKPWRFFSISRQIRKTLREERPDILHLHFVTNVLMCRLALRRDKTIRLFQVPGPLHLENKLISYVERTTATKVDYWAGACKKTCADYINKGIDSQRVHLAYYGVSPMESAPEPCKNTLRSEYGISGDTRIVAMVSYFYKPKKYLGQKRGLKGHEDFIDAMKIVMQKYNEVVPVIIGNAWDGSEAYELQVQEYARRVLGNQVIFTGYRKDVYDIYPEIDVAVHPSHSENLGGAAESLLFAVPTISSDVGGFPDIVIPGETGCLVKAKDPDDLAEKIEWAITHPEEMKKMAEKGRKLVDGLLAIETTASAVYNIYRKLLS